MNSSQLKKLPLSEVYRRLYPWSKLDQFVKQLKDTIAYKSEDNSLIALNKPFGVGLYTVHDNNSSKQNQDKLLSRIVGHPRYCISDALESLSQEFNSTTPYQILKGIDRYMSGLVLITNDLKTKQPNLIKAIATGNAMKQPSFGFRAITSGYPLVNEHTIKERVGVSLLEVDELGDHKEPIIVKNPGNSFKNKFRKDLETFQTEMQVKKINREYSAAYLELYVSKLKWDFPRCYISSKTSFILGDVRFSKRIREILGRPIQVSAFKSSHKYDDSYEPLNSKLQKLLGVHKNSSIPLMLDLHAIRLKGFDRTQKSRDLFIQSPYMPVHFALTAERLKLLDKMVDANDDLVNTDHVERGQTISVC